MPTLQTTKSDLKQQVTANIGKVLQELGQLIQPESSNFNSVLVMQTQFQRLQQEAREGRISREQHNVEYGDLTRRTLDLIDALEEKDISTPRLLQYDIYDRILIVTKSKTRADYLGKFFPTDYFHNVEYNSSGQPLPAESANIYDIILYDNQKPDQQDDKNKLLLYYLNKTSPVVLYFGGFLQLLFNYPEKAYATNSVFSLHARIREMSDYLRYRRATEHNRDKQQGDG